MSKYEVGQKWANDASEVTVESIATSYDNTYIRYALDERTYESTDEVFTRTYPNAVGAVAVAAQAEPLATKP